MTTDSIPSGRPRSQWWLWIGIILVLLGVVGMTGYRDSLRRRLAVLDAAIHQAGEPTTSKEADGWYSAVPADENAALKIMEAADLLVPNSTRMGDGDWPARGESLTAEPQRQLEEIVSRNSSALENLHAAALLPKSRYFVDLSKGPATLLPHLAKVKSLAQLLRAEATLSSSLGQTELAVRSIHRGLSLARSLETEPILISQLVRLACLTISGRSLEHVLSRQALEKGPIEALALGLAAAETQSQRGFRRAFVGERCLGRYIYDLPIGQSVQVFEQGANDVSVVLHFALKVTGIRDQDFLFYLRTMDEWIKTVDLPFPECLTRARQVSDRCQSEIGDHRLFVLSAALLPSLQGAIEKEAEVTALLRCGQVALAIERFRLKNEGRLPDRLEQVTPAFLSKTLSDPYDGSPLRYKRLNKGYVVFSVGKDGKDDGGAEPVRKAGSSKPSDVTFVVAR